MKLTGFLLTFQLVHLWLTVCWYICCTIHVFVCSWLRWMRCCTPGKCEWIKGKQAVCSALTERLMPENDLFTCIYREGKLPYNGTNTGIHRCENAQKTLHFPYGKTWVNVWKMPRFPWIQSKSSVRWTLVFLPWYFYSCLDSFIYNFLKKYIEQMFLN